MTKTADVVRIAPEPCVSRAPSRTLRRVGLSDVERSAAVALVRDDEASVAELVQDRATAYATGDPDVRRRSLSRAAAVEEAQMQQLGLLLVDAVARRDEPAVRLLDRTLSSATTRYRALLDQLRVEFASTRKVTMTAVGPVTISAQESR